MQTKPSKPKKPKLTIELDPETASGFTEIIEAVSKNQGELISMAPIAAGILSLGISQYRQDPGFAEAILQNRLNKYARYASIRKRAQSITRKKVVQVKPMKDTQQSKEPKPQDMRPAPVPPDPPPPPPPPPPG